MKNVPYGFGEHDGNMPPIEPDAVDGATEGRGEAVLCGSVKDGRMYREFGCGRSITMDTGVRCLDCSIRLCDECGRKHFPGHLSGGSPTVAQRLVQWLQSDDAAWDLGRLVFSLGKNHVPGSPTFNRHICNWLAREVGVIASPPAQRETAE